MRCHEATWRVDDEQRHHKVEQARQLIFRHGVGINGQRIKTILQEESLVPTSMCSVNVSLQYAFNFFLMLVVDLLHVFELGVWKAIFTHLMHILAAAGGVAVQELNLRYCQVPTFGRGTIRHFHRNASVIKCLAARDFEDLLQVRLILSEF
ncbi:hypothetical protein DFJ58DRAFT_668566 [Suillus subalutaceus]|uniref:uncharacterized protein n=1 Tax=Suillus subalutaceus TaxID=48586 RepID=UPI001B86AA48|nr:uncharacterized protein DFJ58DRAFT_668566 [Suillus subalutaceus]KAG1838099.1 hypothetical protein DFJ58DRAFT_668566 [Suillus subalutaceus]